MVSALKIRSTVFKAFRDYWSSLNLESHQKASKAIEKDEFKNEIISVNGKPSGTLFPLNSKMESL